MGVAYNYGKPPFPNSEFPAERFSCPADTWIQESRAPAISTAYFAMLNAL